MKRLLCLMVLCMCSAPLFAQMYFNTDFEWPVLPPQTDYTQMIDTGNYFIYDATYSNVLYGRKNADSSYEGFTISNIQDSLTPGIANDRAAFPAIGHDHSAQYVVGHGVSGMFINQVQPVKPTFSDTVYGVYVTNATIDVLSMEQGDSTAKKFGGSNGSDSDWLLLKIKGYRYWDMQPDSIVHMDSVSFYLADYRSDTSANDYIVKDWTWVDLTSLGEVDSLSFSMSSSDVDSNGSMRTPAYFCIDDMGTGLGTGAVHEVDGNQLISVYPNPATSGAALFINAKGKLATKHLVFEMKDISGRSVQKENLGKEKSIVLPKVMPGIYTIQLWDDDGNLADVRKLLVR